VAFVNYNNKEITAKIVYYGPALSGKTTCLRYIYTCSQVENKGKLITLDTDGDRTLFFDFLPLEIGKLGNYTIKIQLYTVPGQVAYDTTRKLVLQGADGVVFVADSQVVMREQNIDSFSNLKKNLRLNNLNIEEIPLIFHLNKRDLKEILPLDTLNKDLNREHKPFFPTVATSGENVIEGLHAVIKLVIIHLKNKLSIFQKDKTVMFSREEVTAAAPKQEEPRKPAPAKPAPTSAKESTSEIMADTEEEEIFELSSPMSAHPEAEFEMLGEDEIFNLTDSHELPSDEPEIELVDSDIEVPDLSFDLEEQKSKPENGLTPIPVRRAPDETAELAINISGDSADVPIRLQIPEGSQEIHVNLRLTLTIKKK
jgi:mutual gliding-motility protein MglA